MKVTFIILCFFPFALSAQSFLKRVPKPASGTSASDGAAPVAQNVFRPVANLMSYSVPDNSLLSGAGVSYQHLKWNAETGKWYAEYSFNALAWYKASLSGESNAFSYGIAVGAFNNLLLVGVATDSKKVFATVGLGISLNN